MILLYKELIKKYKSNYKIKKLIEEGKIFKIEKGIYSDKKDVNYLEIISKKYPNAIFTMDSAFYYHNLTDVIPEKEHLALKRDSTKISDSRIKVVYYQDKFFGGLRVPKQNFGVTNDNAGFSGGESLSIISSRYAKMIKRIQNTLI